MVATMRENEDLLQAEVDAHTKTKDCLQQLKADAEAKQAQLANDVSMAQDNTGEK